MKFCYVLEDGDIIKKIAVGDEVTDSFVDGICKDHFETGFEEKDVEKNGILYSISEVEMVFVTDIDTDDEQDLWK